MLVFCCLSDSTTFFFFFFEGAHDKNYHVLLSIPTSIFISFVQISYSLQLNFTSCSTAHIHHMGGLPKLNSPVISLTYFFTNPSSSILFICPYQHISLHTLLHSLIYDAFLHLGAPKQSGRSPNFPTPVSSFHFL